MRQARHVQVQAPPPAWRPTSLGAFLVTQGVVLAAAPWWLAQPGAAALGAGLLTACGWSALATRSAGSGIRAAWNVPTMVHVQRETDVAIAVTSKPGSAPGRLLYLDPGTGRWVTAVRLAAGGGGLTVPVALRFPRRGPVTLPAIRVRSELPFALVATHRAVSDPAEVLVLPALGKVPRHLDRALSMWAEDLGARGIAGDDEIDRLRAWQPGDPPRLVHWPSTARAGKLLVVERRAVVGRRCSLVVDLEGAGESGQGRFERLLVAAATLCSHLSRGEWQVDLRLASAANGGPVIEPARQWEVLALAQPGSGDPLSAIPNGQPAIVVSRRKPTGDGLRPAPLWIGPEIIDQIGARA
ncbi:hypothetical protein LBMAG53_18110 [Planctomycetota bacterium]|nr:hypothetical protein LBMAG53_18110 [Planctomycetota bacterium]